MRNSRLLIYRVAVILVGFGVGMALKAIKPGISQNEIALYGLPILFVLIILVPLRFKSLRAPVRR